MTPDQPPIPEAGRDCAAEASTVSAAPLWGTGDWRACWIGSCNRHQDCMYHPCRAAAHSELSA